MERILKRNSPCGLSCNTFPMKSYSTNENIYGPNINRYPVYNNQLNHTDEILKPPNNIPTSNSSQYSPKKSELEKLFSHATEVKGDLESVIHALVGIIGNGPKEPTHASDSIIHESTIESQNISQNDFNPENPPTNFIPEYNFKWQNDNNAPSVNVENVLKNVRANKIKYDKFQLCNESSQSSGSSKERFADKIDYSLNLKPRNVYNEGFRSMLSDPGHVDQSKSMLSESENPRKHKSQYSSMYKDCEKWNSAEILVKKIKSVTTATDINDEITQKSMENRHTVNEPMSIDNNHIWTSSNPMGNCSQYQENRCKFNWQNHALSSPIKRSDSNIYRNVSNFNWSPGKELLNEYSVNGFADDNSCSSWSKISPINPQFQNSKSRAAVSSDRTFDKQTPSVSVSDSEGSTEPIREPPVKRIPRLPSLCTQLRNKQGQYEVVLLNQPEQQHRARYMTEGSRGAVKDRSGNGYPTVQLIGWKQPATLQIFVGSEDGRVKPHTFYQACKVSGKQILACKERIFDNAGLIEVQLEAMENQTIILDCIGILKLRNVDVERRAGIQRIKQKSTMARLIFRVNLPHGDGYFTCLQVASDPILCTQPVGTPEISKMSLYEGSCKGNMELFIIGKNIVKCSRVLFQDYSEHSGVIWQAEAKIDIEYLQQTHLICTVPPYCDEKLKTPVTVQVVLNCSGRLSEPRYFTYIPEISDSSKKPIPFKYIDWKNVKPDFADGSEFPNETSSLNLESSNLHIDPTIIKSTTDIYCGLEYMKTNENTFNPNLHVSLNNETNYTQMFSITKNQNGLPINTEMSWIPCTISKDIPISKSSSAHEGFSNSLDSNIETDCMLQDSSIMSQLKSESIINRIKSTEILTDL